MDRTILAPGTGGAGCRRGSRAGIIAVLKANRMLILGLAPRADLSAFLMCCIGVTLNRQDLEPAR
jgi:hypothetical protein